MTSLPSNVQNLWRRLSGFDIAAVVIFALGAGAMALGISGAISNFLKFLAVLAAFYLIFRFIGWWRSRLLWSLRNRLIVAYVFIAAVPILLILILGFLAGRILYSQLGAYLVYEDIHARINTVADMSEHIAMAHSTPLKGISEEEAESILAAQSHAVHDQELPGLTITFSDDATLLRKVASGGDKFGGLLQEEDKLALASIRAIPGPRVRVVELKVPVTPELLAAMPGRGSNSIKPDAKIYRGGAASRYLQIRG